MMKKHFFVLAAIIIGSQLQAQEDSTSISLNEVTITSNKYPKKRSETGKVITVIDRAQLDRSGGKTLSEVLNTISGTTIIGANNALGTNQTVSIRGASAGNVLILIDGIPANDPSVITNYFDLNLIAIDQVERVEILKGGQSTLYGSDAVAGVINIITRKAGPKKFSINGGFTGGSYNTFKETIGISARGKKLDFTTNYTHLDADGFSTAKDQAGTGKFDDDGYRQHALNARVGWKLGDRVRAHFTGTYNNYQTDLDASGFTDEKDYAVTNDNVQFGTGLLYDHKMGTLRFNYNFNYTERNYFDDSIFKSSPYTDWSTSKYMGRSHFLELYSNWNWTNWELLTGADYRLNNTDQFYFSSGSFGPYGPPVLNAKANQFSPYASLIYKRNAFTTELGGRWNIHSEYGSNFSFSLNPSYRIGSNAKVFANVYSAFKTPTLYQLFDIAAGNPDLDPEKGLIGEAGVEVTAATSFRAGVTGFYRRTKDAIVYTSDPVTFESLYINVSKQTNYGAELEASYTAGKFFANANYTFTDGKLTSPYDGTGAPIGKDTSYTNLYRIPKHAINLGVGVNVTKAWLVSADLKTVSRRDEFVYGGAPAELKGYTLIGLYTEYKFSGLFRAFVDLKNITNKEYVDILGYNTRKFNFTVGLNFNW